MNCVIPNNPTFIQTMNHDAILNIRSCTNVERMTFISSVAGATNVGTYSDIPIMLENECIWLSHEFGFV